MEQPLTMMMRIKGFFGQKKVIWTIVGLVVVFGGWFLLFGRGGTNSSIQTGVVKRQDLQKTVLTTGQVVSSTDLGLSFQATGVVKALNVKEGDKVYTGQVLATLDQSNTLASLQSAEGSLASAKANYNKILAAATPQDVAVSQAAVDSASTALANAKQNLLNELTLAQSNTNTEVLSATNSLFSNPQSSSPQFGVSGTVQTNGQLVSNVNSEKVNINGALLSWQAEVATISDSNVDNVVTDSLANLSTVSSYFADILNILTSYSQANSSTGGATLATDQVAIASAKTTVDSLSTAIVNYSQAVKSAQASLNSSKALLDLKQAPARSEDVAIAAAQVLSAQGQVDLANANLNNTVLRAPANGTITQVDVKLGEQAQALKEVLILQDVGELHTEADVSEADIASVTVGQSIDNTFDALGPDQHFTSKVLTVNPASIVISGVVDYKVTGSLTNIPGVKPGMTANMTILVASTTQSLSVPSSAIVNKDGKQYVKVITDPKKNTYTSVEVKTGLEADGGLTKILSGLTEGQAIVTYIK
jgi:HlyD family secretion protein